jgi:hypothetical protein
MGVSRVWRWGLAGLVGIVLAIAALRSARDPLGPPPTGASSAPPVLAESSGSPSPDPARTAQLEGAGGSERGRSEVAEVPAGTTAAGSDLRVVVLDAAGRPLAGVPVELIMRARLRPEFASALAAAVSTAPQGIAVLPKTARTVSALVSDPAMAALEGLVRCTLPFDDPVEAALRAEHMSGEPIRLVLPPAGWVEITADGSAVELFRWQRILEHGFSPLFEAQGAAARIGPLGLGWRIRIEARSAGRVDAVGILTLDGPTRADEIVCAVLEVTPALRIEGVAVDEDGAPLASVTLVAELGLADQVLDTYSKTDAAGRFAVEIGAGAVLEYLELRRCDIPRPVPTGRFVPQGRPTDAAVLDVGRIELLLPEPAAGTTTIAAGIVLDDSNAPLSGALVVALARPGERASALASVRTAEDGLFRLVGVVPPEVEEVEVQAGKRGFTGGERIRCVVGQEGVRLALALGATLVGRVHVSDWVPRDLVSIELHGGEAQNRRVLADWGEEILFEGEDEHEAVLEVGIRKASWVVERRAGIFLRKGERVELDPIDARERFRLLHLVVRDGEGRPLPGLKLRLLDAFGEGFRALETSSAGEIVNLVPSEVGRLHASAEGYEDAVIELSATPVEVTLHARDG